MSTLRLILGDQLSFKISSLEKADPSKDIIMMSELLGEKAYAKKHKKSLIFLFSTMRHFARDLKEKGYNVIYTKLDEPLNQGSIKGELERILNTFSIEKIVVTHPSDFKLFHEMQHWEDTFKIPVKITNDSRFLCSLKDFKDWSKKRKNLRMEYFYREIRKKYSILMKDDQPIGGKWNYDLENRSSPKNNLVIPRPYIENNDEITLEVIELVKKHFPNNFGDLKPFSFSVTRKGALKSLELFISQRLKYFGEYQDAMVQNEPWMYHSHISFYLNCGLLLPHECATAAENAYYKGDIPLNAAEGFIRQIIGWREYIRGIYWLKMPEYAELNFFKVQRSLPDFYWTAETKMNCLHQAISETKRNAYAHHIQRLMILGNFALLAGIDPKQVNDWFLNVYADAYEWVELPNVSGMSLFADGGFLASKPYAAGGNYINKMSTYCKNCDYKVSHKNGPKACPFNYLYWDFLARNRKSLQSNHRIGMLYKTYDRMDEKKKKDITNDSYKFLNNL